MKFKEVTEIVSRDELKSTTTEYREELSFKDLIRSVIKQYEDFVDACPDYKINCIFLDYSVQTICIKIDNRKDFDKLEFISVYIKPEDQW